ncbi:MAG TPA: ABC transporter permease [Chitinophagales bacterium]|nr:ABC transporter permease [Chitinophagales bacterium]
MNLAPVLGIEAVKLNRLANYVLLGVLLLIYGGVVWSGYYTFSRAGLDENTVGMFFHNVLQVEGSFVGLFVALFVIINIGKEYADGTLRKNIIDGYSRQQFFTGKLAIMFLAALGVFMLGKIALLCGGMLIGRLNGITQLITGTVLVKSFLDILTTAVFTFFLVFVTRSIVLSIVLFFVWSILESVITQLARVLFDVENIGRFLPLGSIDTAISLGRLAGTETILAAVFYAAAMLAISYLLFLRRDIK